MKKLLCAVLALVLALGCAFAFAEEAQPSVEELNATIGELTALVEKYKPYYDAQLAITYGDDGVIWVDDVMAEYDASDAQYKSYYGYGLADLGVADMAKQQIAETLLSDAVMRMKAQELGLIDLGEEAMESYKERAAASFNENIDLYAQYMNSEAEEITDEMRESTKEYLVGMGMTEEGIMNNMILDEVDTAVKEYATKDIEVTDEDVQAAYDEAVASDKESFADSYNYYSALSSGETIAWRPEGYRYIKQVLIGFDDDQSAKLTELNNQLTSLQDELAALDEPADESAEEPAEKRTAEEINKDIEACNAEIDALYEELMPKAQEVIDKFNAGTKFEDLITEYNTDPGMKSGTFAETGYPVSADSTVWVQSFTDGSMAIKEKGRISEPTRSNNGIHVMYYADDMPSGEAGIDAVRDALKQTALETKQTAAYNDLIASWVAEMNPEYHYENLGIAG